jgi:pyruvate formate lyase activating enzyme
MTASSPRNVAGQITGIGRFSTKDGPGIRTTVFLKGCPLRCAWCSSPETWNSNPDLCFHIAHCERCGACLQCPEAAIDLQSPERIARLRCTRCMLCVDLCPHGALAAVGRQVTVGDVVDEVVRDMPFYQDGGGATLGGGEPLAQPEFLAALVATLRAAGVSVVLDTSGYGPSDVLEQLMPQLDLVLLDIKHMDPQQHRERTGVTNDLILDNARRIAPHHKLRISLPLIPGFNDDSANVLATGEFARGLGVESIDLMPMHQLGAARYGQLGIESPFPGFPDLGGKPLAGAVRLLESMGLRVTVGRMM